MQQIFEMLMLISFGISWPTAILKSLRTRTATGKSLLFLCFIFIGYAFGIVSKLISGQVTYVVTFYVINLIMVGIDIGLYFRNKGLDARRGGRTSD